MSCICGHEYLLHGAGDHNEYKGCVKTGCECAEYREAGCGHTPGAERAARKICDWENRYDDSLPIAEAAGLISLETHDAEMLQALKALLEAATARVAPGLPDMDKAVARAVAVIAQAEGRQP